MLKLFLTLFFLFSATVFYTHSVNAHVFVQYPHQSNAETLGKQVSEKRRFYIDDDTIKPSIQEINQFEHTRKNNINVVLKAIIKTPDSNISESIQTHEKFAVITYNIDYPFNDADKHKL